MVIISIVFIVTTITVTKNYFEINVARSTFQQIREGGGMRIHDFQFVMLHIVFETNKEAQIYTRKCWFNLKEYQHALLISISKQSSGIFH